MARVVVVCDRWEEKNAAAQCTNITYLYPVFCFVIIPAQLCSLV